MRSVDRDVVAYELQRRQRLLRQSERRRVLRRVTECNGRRACGAGTRQEPVRPPGAPDRRRQRVEVDEALDAQRVLERGGRRRRIVVECCSTPVQLEERRGRLADVEEGLLVTARVVARLDRLRGGDGNGDE